ncbi:CD276 antigen homolog [Cetorhinus maximus]
MSHEFRSLKYAAEKRWNHKSAGKMNTDMQGGHKRMIYLLHVLIAWGQALLSDGFDVTVPETTLIGIHNQNIVLGCRFTVNGGLSLEHIIITWQRAENSEVVHSYYYGKDQLSQQSEQYSDRTSLFPEEFKHGNASLKLEGVRAEDAGQYICFVSNILGSAKETILLKFAAHYKDPELLIKLQPTSSIFILKSQGYPKASVLWYCAEAQGIQEHNPHKEWWIVFGFEILVFAAIIVLAFVIFKQRHDQQRKMGKIMKYEIA